MSDCCSCHNNPPCDWCLRHAYCRFCGELYDTEDDPPPCPENSESCEAEE